MKYLIWIITFLFSIIAIATIEEAKMDQLTVDLDLVINSKKVQQSKIVTDIGKTSSAAQLSDEFNGTFIEVTSKSTPNNKIMMEFQVGKIVNKEKKLISKPIIVSDLDQKSEIKMSDDESNIITLAVIPTVSNNV